MDELMRHVVNYIVKESGLRDFCSKCGMCCTVCYPDNRGYGRKQKGQPDVGCRNAVCVSHICSELEDIFVKEKDPIYKLLRSLVSCHGSVKCQLKLIDLPGIAEEVQRNKHIMIATLDRISRGKLGGDYIQGKLSFVKEKGVNGTRKINKRNLTVAAKFDEETDRIFGEVLCKSAS